MRRFGLGVFAIGLCLVFSGGVARGDDATTQPTTSPSATAEDVAKDYASLLLSAHPKDAIHKYWNWDLIFDEVFGDDMKQVSADQRKQMQYLIWGFLDKIYSNPVLADMMAHATASGYSTHETADGNTAVDFTCNMTLPSGEKATAPNELVFSHNDGQWHVLNASANGNSFIDTLKKEYSAKTSWKNPLEYLTALTAQSP